MSTAMSLFSREELEMIEALRQSKQRQGQPSPTPSSASGSMSIAGREVWEALGGLRQVNGVERGTESPAGVGMLFPPMMDEGLEVGMLAAQARILREQALVAEAQVSCWEA